MRQDDAQLDQAVVEAAVEATLRGWGDELYTGQKLVDGLEPLDP